MAAASKVRAMVAVLPFLIWGMPLSVSADLTMDMYRAAVRSDAIMELLEEGLDGFIGVSRPEATVAIMFHERSCGICHTALPEYDAVAKAMQGRGDHIHFGHIESANNKEGIKRRAHLRGFPSVLVWRARTASIGDEDLPEALMGQILVVTADQQLMLRASRLAGLAEEKDSDRLKALGKQGEVKGIDLFDSTAMLRVDGLGKVWLPLETLRREDGRSLPYHRAEAAFMYQGVWAKADMQHFMENMLAPLVTEVKGRRWEALALKEQRLPALILCGPEATQGFVEVASVRQGKARAFHVKEASDCPIPVSAPGQPQVIVYSTPGQQWSGNGGSPSAAVAIAGPDVVADDGALVRWAQSRKFPGLTKLHFHNFAELVNADRHSIIVALRNPNRASEPNKLVERKLREVAQPQNLDSRIDEYTYVNDSFHVGVIDGTLDGMDAFGVSPDRLPRVLVFEGADTWVEDAAMLTVERLPTDLQKLPHMWRMSRGIPGYLTWFARLAAGSYMHYDEMVVSALGGAGAARLVLPALICGMFFMNVRHLFISGRALLNSVQEPDLDEPAEPGPPPESKKRQ